MEAARLQGLDCAPLVPLPILTAPLFRVREEAHDGFLGSFWRALSLSAVLGLVWMINKLIVIY